MTKQEALDKLREAHDVLREHPYRISFREEYETDYCRRLLDLSHAWSDLIYRSDIGEDERKLMKRFGDWIHNYNASIHPRHIKRNLIPFYETVISLTHRYLNTGEIRGYCSLEYRWYNSDDPNERTEVPMMFYLVTKETCGIDSPELPRFFPESEKLSEDTEAIRKYLSRRLWNKSDKEIDDLVREWENNLLPIIKWHNKNLGDNLHVAPIFYTI